MTREELVQEFPVQTIKVILDGLSQDITESKTMIIGLVEKLDALKDGRIRDTELKLQEVQSEVKRLSKIVYVITSALITESLALIMGIVLWVFNILNT